MRTVWRKLPKALARAHGSEIATVRQKISAKCVPSDRNPAQEEHRKHKMRTVRQKCDPKQRPSDRKEAITITEIAQGRRSAQPLAFPVSSGDCFVELSYDILTVADPEMIRRVCITAAPQLPATMEASAHFALIGKPCSRASSTRAHSDRSAVASSIRSLGREEPSVKESMYETCRS